MTIDFFASRVSTTLFVKVSLSTSILPTSSMTMTSADSRASASARIPSPSSAARLTPNRPDRTRDFIVSWAKTSCSLVSQFVIWNPVRRCFSTIGSVTIPPTTTPSSSRSWMIRRRVCVFPDPGRPVIPIFTGADKRRAMQKNPGGGFI